jgi:hypothetical protein
MVSDLVQVGLDQVVFGLGDGLPLRALARFFGARVSVGGDRRDGCSKSVLLFGLPAPVGWRGTLFPLTGVSQGSGRSG